MASAEFVQVFKQVYIALVEHIEPRDCGTMLHAYLADRIAQCMAGDDLLQHGEMTPEIAEEYRRACEDRDYALRTLEIADPFCTAERAGRRAH
jgi:hypothetical protein